MKKIKIKSPTKEKQIRPSKWQRELSKLCSLDQMKKMSTKVTNTGNLTKPMDVKKAWKTCLKISNECIQTEVNPKINTNRQNNKEEVKEELRRIKIKLLKLAFYNNQI